MIVKTVNPATGQLINNYNLIDQAEIDKILSKSIIAQVNWDQLGIDKRAEFFLDLAKKLKTNDNLNLNAHIITTEMGKPITQARAEIEKCAWVCEHYANSTKDYLQEKIITTENKKSYIAYKPLGIIFGIMPWNFPFWQVFRFAVPALMAGNAVIIKHAENCIGSSLAIKKLFNAAGFPEYVYNNLIINHNQAADLIKNAKIAGVSLTGSDRAGSIVGANAAQHIKKAVLELGGNDPYIILEDADLEHAAQACLTSRLNNTGQVCIAAKRFIVVKKIAEQFKKIILDKINNFKMGDPMLEDTKLGPLARADLRDNLHKQVTESIMLGAKCLLGGHLNSNTMGYYYPITVLDNITSGMPAYHEELFGPVICFINAKDEIEAIKIANDSKYGLAAAVFTKDIKKGEDIATNKIQAGAVAVNNLVSSDPRLPFGGIKSSGYGRELGQEGIHEFVNVKTIVIS